MQLDNLNIAAALHAAAIRKLSNAFSGMILQRHVGSKIILSCVLIRALQHTAEADATSACMSCLAAHTSSWRSLASLLGKRGPHVYYECRTTENIRLVRVFSLPISINVCCRRLPFCRFHRFCF